MEDLQTNDQTLKDGKDNFLFLNDNEINGKNATEEMDIKIENTVSSQDDEGSPLDRSITQSHLSSLHSTFKNSERDDSIVISHDHSSLGGNLKTSFDSPSQEAVEDFANNSPSPPFKPKFARQYSCDLCSYITFKPKDYLHHLQDAHDAKLKVFECPLCDYGTRYSSKLTRHLTTHNNSMNTNNESSELSLNESPREEELNEDQKVRPLKLKRLFVKAPSLFQVTHESRKTMASQSQDATPEKKVFRMVLSADGSHRYQCEGCMYHSNNLPAVKRHHALCHSKLLQCESCDYSTTSQPEYYEHIYTHGSRKGKTYLKCDDCSYVTTCRNNFSHHRSFHERSLPFKCFLCNFSSDSETKIKRHMALQHTNRCMVPDSVITKKEVETDDRLIEDKPVAEEDSIEEEPMETEAQRYQSEVTFTKKKSKKGPLLEMMCPEPDCNVLCLRRGNLTRHLIAKHNLTFDDASSCSLNVERQIIRKKTSSISGVSRKRPALNVSLLKRPFSIPLKRPIVAPSAENLKCSECSYYAKWPSDLRRHMHVHTLVKRFKCTMCSNKYKYVGDLNVHMRRDHLVEPTHSAVAEEVHSGDVIRKNSPAVFRCPICVFSARNKAELEQHSKQHGDIEKTFQCRLCDYQTYWRGDVGRHLYRHHEISLTREAGELEEYFVIRSEIKPLSKILAANTPEGIKVEKEDAQSVTRPMTFKDCLSSNEGIVKKPNPDVRKSTNPSGKEGLFPCPQETCDNRFSTAEKLQAHLAVHENLKQYMCPTCGKRSNWKWDVVKHMARVHSDINATVEDIITLSIEEARDTIEDYRSCFEKKPIEEIYTYACSLCDYKSGERTQVSSHLNENHANEDGDILSFSVVSKKGDQNSDSAKFLLPPVEELAKLETPFACSLCNKSEATLDDVKRHYSYTHPYKDMLVIYTVDGTEFNCETLDISRQPGNGTDQMGPPSAKSSKLESKFSNPKVHGYIKPFKCSICGLRSNWKWDLKKHLRAKHSGQGGFVIMLSMKEAQMTYGKECSRSHPKCENQVTSPTSMPTDREDPLPETEQSSPMPESSPTEFHETEGLKNSHISTLLGTDYDPSRRQWKCSGCAYITNWRRNMARHMAKHHPKERPFLRAVSLHIAKQDTLDKILEERKRAIADLTTRNDLEVKKESLIKITDQSTKTSGQSSPGDRREWNCPKCSFQSSMKTHIILHMQKHDMKPYECGECGVPFMNRGPLHNHIKRYHQYGNYSSLSRININYDLPKENNSFRCSLCQAQFSNHLSALQHAQEIHGEKDGSASISPAAGDQNQDLDPLSTDTIIYGRNRKLYHCRLCPYVTQRKTMLTFHMTYHKPTATNRFKCKHCTYHVSTIRLLHQHQRKWHSDSRRVDSSSLWEHQIQPPPSNEAVTESTQKYQCTKCPFTTRSNNDFFCHKQFHRPRRNAVFKCDYCDYWVVHKRLLKQHMKLHEQTVRAQESSPPKPVYSDIGLHDPRELAETAALKQSMISAKILPSLSTSPKVSPMKIVSRCSVNNKPEYLMKNGVYRKVHRCPKCPYFNTRSRNIQLHIMMHGPRDSPHPLIKCPHCDYHVGSKGLLSHHLKVHQKNYGDSPENDAVEMYDEGGESDDADIQPHQKVDALLQISRMKKFGCEKCPYASAKRQHFERHQELHGSRQRYTCQYCDYSVPSSYLLTQHSRLHMMPNQNLLTSQSINNLQHLNEVPADVALAAALPPSDSDMSVTISVIHDHLGLYENSIYDPEQKKLYRCDRCPYSNIRRDHLLSHLKFHMVSSSFVCPYCDYSAPKQPLLTQHVRVHFCPLPELSEWLVENGQAERDAKHKNIDLAEALKVAREYQNQSKKKQKDQEECNDNKKEKKESVADSDLLICQYCDREFASSEKLVKHELQHLIGNQFEMALKVLKLDTVKEKNPEADDKEKQSNDHKADVEKIEQQDDGNIVMVLTATDEMPSSDLKHSKGDITSNTKQSDVEMTPDMKQLSAKKKEQVNLPDRGAVHSDDLSKDEADMVQTKSSDVTKARKGGDNWEEDLENESCDKQSMVEKECNNDNSNDRDPETESSTLTAATTKDSDKQDAGNVKPGMDNSPPINVHSKTEGVEDMEVDEEKNCNASSANLDLLTSSETDREKEMNSVNQEEARDEQHQDKKQQASVDYLEEFGPGIETKELIDDPSGDPKVITVNLDQ